MSYSLDTYDKYNPPVSPLLKATDEEIILKSWKILKVRNNCIFMNIKK